MPERIRTNYDIKNNKIWYSNEEIEHKLLYRYVIKYNKGVYSSYKPNKKCGIA